MIQKVACQPLHHANSFETLEKVQLEPLVRIERRYDKIWSERGDGMGVTYQ